MDTKTILILGGYGNTGKRLAQLLLQETNVRLLLAGRNIEKAEQAASQFNSIFDGKRVAATSVDASNTSSLERVFKNVDIVVVASPTANYVKEIADAALRAGIDYLDIQYSTSKTALLNSWSDRIRSAGRCFITDGGFHPGLPAMLVRYGAQFFDKIDTAIVSCLIQFDWRNVNVSKESKVEFVEELVNYKALIYRHGTWKKTNMWNTRDFAKMDFGKQFGIKVCSPMFFEEMIVLPQLFPSMQFMGCYVAGINWFVDYFVFPFSFAILKLFPKIGLNPMANLIFWSWKTFSTPPYGTVMKLEAQGEKGAQKRSLIIRLEHQDGYWFTAIAVVACLLQYIDGSIRKPGLWYMGDLVEPNRLMKDMERMGINIKVRQDGSNSS